MNIFERKTLAVFSILCGVCFTSGFGMNIYDKISDVAENEGYDLLDAHWTTCCNIQKAKTTNLQKSIEFTKAENAAIKAFIDCLTKYGLSVDILHPFVKTKFCLVLRNF